MGIVRLDAERVEGGGSFDWVGVGAKVGNGACEETSEEGVEEGTGRGGAVDVGPTGLCVLFHEVVEGAIGVEETGLRSNAGFEVPDDGPKYTRPLCG